MKWYYYFLMAFFCLNLVQAGATHCTIPSTNNPVDSLELEGKPVMEFTSRSIDLGTVKKGEQPSFAYHFVNKGDVDLEIEFISVCDCTEIEYSTDPVAPGESGTLSVVFDSNKKDADEVIKIDILLNNTDPATGLPIIESVSYTYHLSQD